MYSIQDEFRGSKHLIPDLPARFPPSLLPLIRPEASMPDFVTLSCPNCGARLDITAEIDRFACSYCGQEHVVRRSGGIVSLAPVVAALNQVRNGVDRAAAELAIVRLQKEIAGLADQRDQYLRANPRPETEIYQPVMVVLGVLAILVSVFLFAEGVNCAGPVLVVGILLLAIGLIPILERPAAQRDWEHLAGEKLKAFAAEIAAKEEELKRARETAAGADGK